MADENRDPFKWVVNGQRVEARYAHGGGIHAVGKAVVYCAEPTVVIRTDSGEQVQWVVSLTHPVDDPCGEITDALRMPARCIKAANHYGERHTADLVGLGSFTWGYLPRPGEA